MPRTREFRLRLNWRRGELSLSLQFMRMRMYKHLRFRRIHFLDFQAKRMGWNGRGISRSARNAAVSRAGPGEHTCWNQFASRLRSKIVFLTFANVNSVFHVTKPSEWKTVARSTVKRGDHDTFAQRNEVWCCQFQSGVVTDLRKRKNCYLRKTGLTSFRTPRNPCFCHSHSIQEDQSQGVYAGELP